jgi:hypothetical protein
MDELINRVFKIWAYTVSHCFLILRSSLKYPDQEEFDENCTYNIDIEFSAVAYIDIPTTLQGIEIKELLDNIPDELLSYKLNLGYKIFELKSRNRAYYIVAGSYRVGKNKWINQDRILNMNLEYDTIITTS